MATVAEIQACFADLRREAESLHQNHMASMERKAQAFPQIGDQLKSQIDDNKQVWRFAQMGLFILESVVVDIKRIADAAEQSEMNTRPRS
jgi:hypothetical protein